jgi:hypothetical protein
MFKKLLKRKQEPKKSPKNVFMRVNVEDTGNGVENNLISVTEVSESLSAEDIKQIRHRISRFLISLEKRHPAAVKEMIKAETDKEQSNKKWNQP